MTRYVRRKKHQFDIISEMESARYARRKVEWGAKGEADL